MANGKNRVKKKSGGAQMKKRNIGRNQGLNYSEEAVERLSKEKRTKRFSMTRGGLRILFFIFLMAFLVVWYMGNAYPAHSIAKKLVKGTSFLLLVCGWITLYIFPKYYYAMIRFSSYEMTEEDEKKGKIKQVRTMVVVCIIVTLIVAILELIIS